MMAGRPSKTPTDAYIGIGSNLGDRMNNCLRAIELMERISGCTTGSCSPFYRTEPVGVQGHEWYINAVISLSTHLSAHRLIVQLQAIEKVMGRKRERKWAPRPIDLDILIFGQEILKNKDLMVPHPLMHLRRFVLVPMVDLAPDLVHPVLGKSMIDLLTALPEEGQTVIPVGET